MSPPIPWPVAQALALAADRDLDRAVGLTNPQGYRVACLKARRQLDTGRLLDAHTGHPEWTPQQLCDHLFTPVGSISVCSVAYPYQPFAPVDLPPRLARDVFDTCMAMARRALRGRRLA